MTIELPEKSFLDSLLGFIGKRRAIYVPSGPGSVGPSPYVKARKESFFTALLRRKAAPLPVGWVYLEQKDEE